MTDYPGIAHYNHGQIQQLLNHGIPTTTNLGWGLRKLYTRVLEYTWLRDYVCTEHEAFETPNWTPVVGASYWAELVLVITESESAHAVQAKKLFGENITDVIRESALHVLACLAAGGYTKGNQALGQQRFNELRVLDGLIPINFPSGVEEETKPKSKQPEFNGPLAQSLAGTSVKAAIEAE